MAYLDTAQINVSNTTWLDRVMNRLDRGLKALQYGKMLQVMSELSDEQLEQIGLERKELPLHAHNAIYGATNR